jgi:hypothetical protein
MKYSFSVTPSIPFRWLSIAVPDVDTQPIKTIATIKSMVIIQFVMRLVVVL